MRKILLLIIALLGLGVSGAWATDGSVTITSSSAAWSENGTFSNVSGSNAGSWRSTNGIISVLCLNGEAAILNYESKSRLTNDKSFLIVANGDNHITGFSIKFKTYNEDGTNRNGYITFHDGVNVNSNSSAEVTKSFSGLNAQVIKFTTGNNWVDIIDFSVSYAEGSDNTLCSTTPINTYNSQAYAGWLKVQTPSDYIFYTMSSLCMNLRTDSYNNDVYLVVSDHQVGSGTTSGLSESDFTAISSNSSGTSSTDVTFNFTNPVTLRGGSIYYLYFATKSDDTYTLSQRGIKVQTGSNSLGVGQNVTDTGIYSSSNTWSIPFTATLTPVTSNLKCRLKAKWPNTSTTAQHYTNYVFAKTNDLDKLYKNNKTELSAADMINAKMVWNVTYSGSGLKLQNVGTERYISKFTSYKANGDAINLLTAENSTNAETLKIQEYNTEGQGYIALVSGNQLSVNNSISFLESYSSTNEYVGCHNNYDSGDAFIFERVKTVTFVDGEGEAFNVAANGGDAVSAIYVACDGSSASTLSLPSDNLYSLDSGETWLSNTDAAEAISAAGTSNISVIVAPAVSVTYNLIWDDPSTPIKTEASVNAYQGLSPSVTVPWDAPAFCDFSYDVSTIEESTTEVNVTIDWDGPFEISADYESAVWYYLKLNGYYVVSNGANATPNLVSELNTGDAGKWAFLGNPYEIQVINKALDGYYIEDTSSSPSMTTNPASWILGKHNNCFTLYSTARSSYFDGYNGVLGYYGSIWGTSPDCTVEEIPDNYYSNLTSGVSPRFAIGTDYFYLDTTKDGYSAAKSLYDAVVASEFCSEADYNTLLNYVNAIDNYILPQTGYYIISSAVASSDGRYGKFMGRETSQPQGVSNGARASAVIILTKTNDGKYTIQSQGEYLQALASSTNITTGSNAVEFTPVISKSGVVSFKNNSLYIHMRNAAGYALMGYISPYSSDAASGWTVTDADEVTIPLSGDIDGKSYATFSAPFPVTIGDGANAYTVQLSGDKAVYSEIASKEIPAGAGILLISETNESSVTATISNSDFSALSSNDLVGFNLSQEFAYPEENDAQWNLVLGNSATTGIGFYRMSGTASGNKAYLPYTYTNPGVKGFTLVPSDFETGISSVVNGQSSKGNVIYDLSGRRVSHPTHGLYIENGKKVLVK